MKNRGIFISVEGPDGSGKSTIVKGIDRWLEKIVKRPYLITKEPGSPKNDACVRMREMLLNPNITLADNAELFLMLADRCQHVMNVLLPALNENEIVVTDRYYDSTYAYQGWGRRHGESSMLKQIQGLNEIATMGLIPDLTILIIVDPEVGITRTTKTEFGKKDTFEQEDIDFHDRVCRGFKDIYKKKKKERNFFLIDSTNKGEQQCLSEVIDYLSNFLERKLNLGE